MSESENEFEKWFKNKCEHECLPYNSMREYCLRQIDLKDLWDYLWKKIVYYKGEFDFYFKKCTEQDDEIAALEARVKELEDSAERRITINNDLIDRIKELEEERNNNVRETVIRN